MLSIKNGKISLTRGDSASICVNLVDASGKQYEMRTGDTLTLTVKERAEDDSAQLLQVVSNTNTIKLAPSDTKNIQPASYSCDIQLETSEGDIFTVVGATTKSTRLDNFIILPEVTV